jgi:hypothetical protein
LLTAEAAVGPTQKTDPRIGEAVSWTGTSAAPVATSVPVPVDEGPLPPVGKHLRGAPSHVPGVQSASDVQLRWACGPVHVNVMGPTAHSPAPSPSASSQANSSGDDESSMHDVGFVGSPGRVQMPPPGHSDVVLHGAPTFTPPRQRRPPQMGPTGPAGSGQSALAPHGS